MEIRVNFFAQARDLAGCAQTVVSLPPDPNVRNLLDHIFQRFPALSPLRSSLRVAVGVDYQTEDYLLDEGEEVSLLPPMQGG